VLHDQFDAKQVGHDRKVELVVVGEVRLRKRARRRDALSFQPIFPRASTSTWRRGPVIFAASTASFFSSDVE
jgi:hypothetical protein